jgi:phosphoglycerate dehydrogenase-like enzyme
VPERHRVVVSEHLSDRPARWLAERCDVDFCPYGDGRFGDALASAEGLIVRTYTLVGPELLSRAPQLTVVGRAGVALENIDVAACRARGVEVVHAPGSNSQAVVEYVLCLLCDALRPRVTVDRPLDADTWERLRAETFAAKQMSEMTLGILGLGRIGKRVAQVGAAIGFDVLYNDVLDIPREERFGADFVMPYELFERSDVITIHVDSRPGNRHFVDARLIERMKPEALVLNTSRGFVIDPRALAAFLRANPKAKAMIDVHDPEPFDASYPLLGLRNSVLLPHLAGRTETALENMSWVVRDVLAVLEGRAPEHPAPRTQEDLASPAGTHARR